MQPTKKNVQHIAKIGHCLLTVKLLKICNKISKRSVKGILELYLYKHNIISVFKIKLVDCQKFTKLCLASTRKCKHLLEVIECQQATEVTSSQFEIIQT